MSNRVDKVDQQCSNFEAKTERKVPSEQQINSSEDHPNKPQTYTRKHGNANIDGQYYESKLLALVLLRLQNDPDVLAFELGANVPGFAKFDDLVCKVVYRDRAGQPSWWFIQLKHRDNLDKKKITIDTLRDKKEALSWKAYFETYLKLRHELVIRNEKVIFCESEFETADIKLVHYTTTLEELDLSNAQDVTSCSVGNDNFLKTSEVGKIVTMQVTDETIECLVQSIDSKNYKHDESLNSLASDFLNKFCIYSGQAKQSKVEEIIKKEIAQTTGYHESQYLFDEYHKIVQEYWKRLDPVPVLTKDSIMFETALNNAKFKSFNEIYRHSVALLRIDFREEIVAAFDFITEQSFKLIIFCSDAPSLTGAKIFKYFIQKELETFIFVNSEETLGTFDIFSAFDNQSQFKELIIICNNYCHLEQICSKLDSLALSGKKVILVSNQQPVEKFKNIFYKLIYQNNNMSELTEVCQNRLLEKSVRFQGKHTKLVELVGEVTDENHVPRNEVSGEVLLSLVKGKDVTLFPEDATLGNLSETDCYIERKFSVCNIISQSILENSPFCLDGKISDDEHREIIVVSDNGDRFKQLNELNNNRKIHWFKKEQGSLVWQESSNGLTNLRPYLEKKEKHFPVESMNDIKDKVTILIGEPGAGKSTVITRLVQQTLYNDNAFIIRVNFLDHLEKIGELKNVSMNYEEALKCLAQFSFNSSQNRNTTYFTDLQKSIIERFSKLGKVYLFFDGFNDVAQNDKSVVLAFLKTCSTCKIGKLLIITRSTGTETVLEEELSVFAHSLVPFTKGNSLDFIKQYLAKTSNSFDSERHDQFSNELLKLFDEIIPLENEVPFLGFPLHCHMVAKCSEKVFQEFAMPENEAHIKIYLNKTHLLEFFLRFAQLKLLIYLNQKCKINIRNKNVNFDECWGNFVDRYRKLSLAVFEEESDLNTDDCSSDLLEKEGIIARIELGKPQFLHSAFCHYFAAIALSEYLRNSCCDLFKSFLQNVLIEILVTRNNHQVCLFIYLMVLQYSAEVCQLDDKASLLLETYQKVQTKNQSIDLLLGIVEAWLKTEPNCRKIRKIIDEQTNDQRMSLMQTCSIMGYACLETVILKYCTENQENDCLEKYPQITKRSRIS